MVVLEIQMNAEECKQPVCEHEDHAIEAKEGNLTECPILSFKDGEFPRNKANVATSHETKPLEWKENGPYLIQASHFEEAHNLRQPKPLHRSGIALVYSVHL